MRKKSKKSFIILFIMIIVSIITALTIISLKSNSKKENSYSIEDVSNNSKNDMELPRVEADLAKSNSYNSDIAKANTKKLQTIIDDVSNKGGGIVYIPQGTYYFESSEKNSAGTEDYVIKCKNNVALIGAGTSSNSGTILKPYGTTDYGLDMFYFNDYSDSGFNNANYLINADFKNFVIDGGEANAREYTSAGKGFMINLFKDCDWDNVVVKNTDGTGFGIDCPINSTIKNCIATNCGKAATINDAGASGFGIGTGFSEDEYIHIIDCTATNNKKFGFFFEHQGRFNSINYTASRSKGYVVSNCKASDNLYDMGGNRANDVTYENCTVDNYYQFENNSRRINVINCKSNTQYEDVTNSSLYYYEPVYWALNKGITAGVSENKFSPLNACTKAQAVTFLWRMEGYQGEVVLRKKSINSNQLYRCGFNKIICICCKMGIRFRNN